VGPKLDDELKPSERRAIRYLEFEAFLKAWNSYLQIQENLERLRSLAPDPSDQDRLLKMEEELLAISKRIFRKVKATRNPL
jgi:hypothetical protein